MSGRAPPAAASLPGRIPRGLIDDATGAASSQYEGARTAFHLVLRLIFFFLQHVANLTSEKFFVSRCRHSRLSIDPTKGNQVRD
jgi:hypothetical protein